MTAQAAPAAKEANEYIAGGEPAQNRAVVQLEFTQNGGLARPAPSRSKSSQPESHQMISAPPLRLKPFDAADVPFFTSMATDPRVTKYVGDGSTWDQATIAEKTNNALRDAPLNELGVARWFTAHRDDQPVGVFVSTRRESAVEIGYWVPPERWGQGIAGAMIDAGLEIIPRLFNTNILIAHVDPNNAASARVLTRRGFHTTVRENGLDRYIWQVGPFAGR